jgi:hypothetical protein
MLLFLILQCKGTNYLAYDENKSDKKSKKLHIFSFRVQFSKMMI